MIEPPNHDAVNTHAPVRHQSPKLGAIPLGMKYGESVSDRFGHAIHMLPKVAETCVLPPLPTVRRGERDGVRGGVGRDGGKAKGRMQNAECKTGNEKCKTEDRLFRRFAFFIACFSFFVLCSSPIHDTRQIGPSPRPSPLITGEREQDRQLLWRRILSRSASSARCPFA